MNIYGMGIVLSMFIPTACMYKRHTGINRGNFINYPAWRKIVYTVIQLLFCIFILGVSAANANNYDSFICVAIYCGIELAGILAFILFHFIINKIRMLLRFRSQFRAKQSKSFFSSDNLPNIEYCLNESLVEYIVYTVCWISYRMLIVSSGVSFVWEIIFKIIRTKETCVINQNIAEPLNKISLICLSIVILFSSWHALIIMTSDKISGSSKTNVSLEHEKLVINRNFRRREHDI